MGEATKIQWCSTIRADGTVAPGYTWSPWHGCAKVSPGCTNCYAEKMSHRNPGVLGVWGKDGTRVVTADWDKPRRWDRAAAKAGERRRVFPSICDPFEDRPELEEVRDRFFGTILGTPNLDWLVLTKRPENVLPYYERLNDRRRSYWHEHAGYLAKAAGLTKDQWAGVVKAYGCPGGAMSLGDSSITKWPLPNLWLGVSAENQQYADERIPALLQIPAAVRFVSYEPALGPVDFSRWMSGLDVSRDEHGTDLGSASGGSDLDWVIVGGESGHGARPFDLAWARDTIRQCQAAGVPVFCKQLGARPIEVEYCGLAPNSIPDVVMDYHLAMGGSEPDDIAHPVRLGDPKGGDITEWPTDLQVREFPR